MALESRCDQLCRKKADVHSGMIPWVNPQINATTLGTDFGIESVLLYAYADNHCAR